MNSKIDKQTRRGFLAAAGIASVAVCRPWNGSREARASDEDAKSTIPFTLGLASYTTRKFTLQETVEMASRLACSMSA